MSKKQKKTEEAQKARAKSITKTRTSDSKEAREIEETRIVEEAKRNAEAEKQLLRERIESMTRDSVSYLLRGIGIRRSNIIQLLVDLFLRCQDSDIWRVEEVLELPYTVCIAAALT